MALLAKDSDGSSSRVHLGLCDHIQQLQDWGSGDWLAVLWPVYVELGHRSSFSLLTNHLHNIQSVFLLLCLSSAFYILPLKVLT